MDDTNVITMEMENPSPSNDIYLEIEVPQKATNSFKAKYKLYALGEQNKETEITSRIGDTSDVSSEIEVVQYDKAYKDVEIDIKYRGYSSILTEIQPIGHMNMPTEIEVRPHNKMWAIYEVQQPPIVTDIFNPTKDAFTRENSKFETINYGSNSSIVAGISNDDIWRSFLQFDLSTINPSYILVDTKLRLYYKGLAPTKLNLEILNADRAWQEHSITNLNKPNPINLIANEFVVNSEKGYVEFDVMDIVKDWVAQTAINNGFILRVANETELGQATFYTRETILPPELVVRYYDSRIFSQGRSQVVTEIFAFSKGYSNKNTEITVDSVFRFEEMPTELYVHRYDTPVPNDIEVEIIASKPLVLTELVASLTGSLEANAEISVWENKNEIINTVLDVIGIPKDSSNEIDVELDVNTVLSSRINTEITISKETVKTEVSARARRNKDLYSSISASRDKINVEIDVKYRSDIWVEIEANIKSDINTEINVSKPFVNTELTVYLSEHNKVETEIDIKSVSQTHAEIFVKFTDDVETEIDIKKVSQIDTEIIVSKAFILTDIVIPTWVEHGVDTVIEPRILMVNNVFTTIQVGSFGGAYAFII